MNLLWAIFDQNPQLVFQLWTIPSAVLFQVLATQGYLSLIGRYICLAVGGFVLAVTTMGPYSALLFVSVGVFLLLVHFVEPTLLHRWTFGFQMSWQTFWHLLTQYQLHWLQVAPDPRVFLAMSSLMLLTQRMTSASMDLQEAKVAISPHGCLWNRVLILVPFLSYSLSFPGLLGGPLCTFDKFVDFVENINTHHPPCPLKAVCAKMLQVLLLVWLKYLLITILKSDSVTLTDLSGIQNILWIWIVSLVFKVNYYAHWAISECVNNAAGLGFAGYRTDGSPVWDGLSDGNPLVTEMSSRVSVFTHRWNRTTATWLRRLVFQRCHRAHVMATFGFSAWWHGLYPGQIVGFLGWAVCVQGDYKLNSYLQPKLTSVFRRWLYMCLSWVHTQMIIACVVVTVELQSFVFVKFLCTSCIVIFPLISVSALFLIQDNQRK